MLKNLAPTASPNSHTTKCPCFSTAVSLQWLSDFYWLISEYVIHIAGRKHIFQRRYAGGRGGQYTNTLDSALTWQPFYELLGCKIILSLYRSLVCILNCCICCETCLNSAKKTNCKQIETIEGNPRKAKAEYTRKMKSRTQLTFVLVHTN